MTNVTEDDDAAKYGYEDPDDAAAMYGYGDAAPDTEKEALPVSYGKAAGFVKQARRSSMKQPGQLYPPTRRRASIDFAPEPTMVEIPAFVPIDDGNASNCNWMNAEEYKKIEKDNYKIIRAIEKGTDKHFCTRGLENKLDPSIERLRIEARQAVWEEQMRQKEEGIYDEVRLRERYHFVVMQSQLEAADRAEQDTAEVENYLRSTRRMVRRMSC